MIVCHLDVIMKEQIVTDPQLCYVNTTLDIQTVTFKKVTPN